MVDEVYQRIWWWVNRSPIGPDLCLIALLVPALGVWVLLRRRDPPMWVLALVGLGLMGLGARFDWTAAGVMLALFAAPVVGVWSIAITLQPGADATRTPLRMLGALVVLGLQVPFAALAPDASLLWVYSVALVLVARTTGERADTGARGVSIATIAALLPLMAYAAPLLPLLPGTLAPALMAIGLPLVLAAWTLRRTGLGTRPRVALLVMGLPALVPLGDSGMVLGRTAHARWVLRNVDLPVSRDLVGTMQSPEAVTPCPQPLGEPGRCGSDVQVLVGADGDMPLADLVSTSPGALVIAARSAFGIRPIYLDAQSGHAVSVSRTPAGELVIAGEPPVPFGPDAFALLTEARREGVGDYVALDAASGLTVQEGVSICLSGGPPAPACSLAYGDARVERIGAAWGVRCAAGGTCTAPRGLMTTCDGGGCTLRATNAVRHSCVDGDCTPDWDASGPTRMTCDGGGCTFVRYSGREQLSCAHDCEVQP